MKGSGPGRLSASIPGAFSYALARADFELVTSDWTSSFSIVFRVFITNRRGAPRPRLTLLLVIRLHGTHNLQIPLIALILIRVVDSVTVSKFTILDGRLPQ